MEHLRFYLDRLIGNLNAPFSFLAALITVAGAIMTFSSTFLAARRSVRRLTEIRKTSEPKPPIQPTTSKDHDFDYQRDSFAESHWLETYKDIEPEPAKPNPSYVARQRVQLRLKEAAALREKEDSTSKWSARASLTLTVGQYIIGGVLASSFVQESLSAKWVGGLGVLVLVASLFKQQFHPEATAEDARKRSLQIRSLVRSSEDQLAILDARIASGENHTDAMIALMTQLTQNLTEIETHDANITKP